MCFRPPTAANGSVKCPKCGAEVDASLDACPNCGATATMAGAPAGFTPPPPPGMAPGMAAPKVPSVPKAPKPPAAS
jgi:predicted amidophosphoribosyltransferase